MEIKQYGRKPFTVEGTQVTEENMAEVAEWCDGEIKVHNGRSYIKVPVHKPLNAKQSQAYVGDWVLLSPTGFKVYIDRAFENSFTEKPGTTKVLNIFSDLEEMRVTDEPVPVEVQRCEGCEHEKPTRDYAGAQLCGKCIRKIEADTASTRNQLGFNTPNNLMKEHSND